MLGLGPDSYGACWEDEVSFPLLDKCPNYLLFGLVVLHQTSATAGFSASNISGTDTELMLFPG